MQGGAVTACLYGYFGLGVYERMGVWVLYVLYGYMGIIWVYGYYMGI